ncbi:MAG: efflux RND transporter periplasmic adaptor subunit [Planctomycetes bacterium]|nr:efflux RND transporter periplasmic adaptor subunit [Planctomycetota bacterium]
MNSARIVGIIAAMLIGGVIGAYLTHQWAPPAAPASDNEPSVEGSPVVRVQTALLQRRRVEQTITAYGSVTTAVGEAHTLSVPFECHIRKVLVTEGQAVEADTPLVEVEPSADAKLELQQAIGDRDAAQRQLKLVEDRLKLKLATQSEIIAAQQMAASVEARVRSLKARGIDDAMTLHADAPGLISQLAARAGQIVPAGTMLVETIGRNQIMVRLGVESDVTPLLKVDDVIEITPVNEAGGKPIEGRIQMISHSVNPQTRLIDVFVMPAEGTSLLLNAYVSGHIVVSTADALTAPRSAVLLDEGRFSLYGIEQGRAVKHAVNLGIEGKDSVQIISDDVHEGEPIIVSGNYQLTDGMAVEVEGGK